MKKILVVDDERPISDIIKFNLTKEGYEVVTAFDGREALEQFEADIQAFLLFWDTFAMCNRLKGEHYDWIFKHFWHFPISIVKYTLVVTYINVKF